MQFSIVTVCYNNRDGLQRTRDSIAQQTERDFEWLVIDGESTDGTKDDLIAWQNEISFACSEKDGGIYDAMNKGLDHAKGRYVIFMNAGDVFASADVLHMTSNSIADNNNPDLLYGDAQEILTSNRTVLKKARHHSKWWWGLWTHHQSIMYRRAAIGDLRYDLSHPTNADYKLTLQILKQAKAITKIDAVISLCDRPGFSAQCPAFARAHQRRARRDVMQLGFLQNQMISLAQCASLMTRRYAPFIFARLRFG